MKFGICFQPLIPQRSEPIESSEMINQLLFGDHYRVLAAGDKWLKIKTVSDEYEGYIDLKCHTPLTDAQFKEWDSSPKIVVNALTKVEINLQPLLLSPGCRLPLNDINWVKHTYINNTISWENAATSFLNAPYLWGGKNPFGIDCSGFTQCIAATQDFSLLRDAYQQAEQGSPCEQKKGALAFFTNDTGKVTHVGICINDHEIIHASGKVRIDSLIETGIVHSETKQITHTLSHFRCIGL